ncbi:MAG: GntR family transcriptional regulator, transcriptional repressor for pyruvate dehydrogenase complex [Solirubrobacteraceae bacterium]
MSAERIRGGEPAPRGASDKVAAEIRAHVSRARLRPGDRLGREEDLARQFGVSRPTLREALRLLASSHLIRASKGRGGGIFVAATPEEGIARSVSASVADMLNADILDIDELIESRLLLEVPIAGLAAQRATEDDVAELRRIVAQVGATWEEVGAIDEAFHARIAQIAGNRLVAAFVMWVAEVLQPSIRQIIEPAVVEEVMQQQHEDVIRAIERGDPDAAERAMREHLVYVQDLVTVVRRMQPDQS